MLAVVTHRVSLVKALKAACDAMHALGANSLEVRHFTSTATLAPQAEGAAFLVLDLGAPGDSDVVEDVTRWAVQHVEGQLILVGTAASPERAGVLCYYLGRLATGELVSVPQSSDPEYWKEVILRHPFAQVMDGLQEALAERLYARVGRAAIPNLVMIRQLFTFAPKNYAIAQIVRHERDGRTPKAKMNALAADFAAAGQASPREFLSAFRLLTYLTLKAEHYASGKKRWRTQDIEKALKQDLPALGRSLRQCTGQHLRTLEMLSRTQVLDILVEMIVPQGARVPFKTRVGRAVTEALADGVRPSRGRSAALRIALLAPIAAGLVLCGGDFDGDGTSDTDRARRPAVSHVHTQRHTQLHTALRRHLHMTIGGHTASASST